MTKTAIQGELLRLGLREAADDLLETIISSGVYTRIYNYTDLRPDHIRENLWTVRLHESVSINEIEARINTGKGIILSMKHDEDYAAYYQGGATVEQKKRIVFENNTSFYSKVAACVKRGVPPEMVN